MCAQMRELENGEISSEQPEQMRDVIAKNVALQSTSLVSTDLQNSTAIFLMMVIPFLLL